MSEVIVGGLAAYEDQTRVEGYPQAKARVELRFDVPEGGDADAALNSVAAKAKAKVAEMLTGKAPRAPVAEGVKTKDDLAAAAGVGPVGPVGPVDKPPAKPRAPRVTAETKPAETTPAKSADDMSEFDVPGTAAATEVSDADLVSAIQKKNAVLKDPDKIRALVAEFNPKPGAPFQSREIAKDKRVDFLAKLEALGK